MDSRSSMVALMLSMTMPTAALPRASMGWRTVVSDGTERPGGNYVVETDHRAIFGNFQSGAGQGADGAEGGHVVEGHDGGEFLFVLASSSSVRRRPPS